MTLQEVQALSDEELRIKVAEFFRWKSIRKVDWALIDVSELSTCSGWEGMQNELEGYISIPDYPQDLNAMHEAEKMLNEMQNRQYNQLLKGPYEAGYPFHATARERAEAFVLTMTEGQQA